MDMVSVPVSWCASELAVRKGAERRWRWVGKLEPERECGWK